MSGEVNKVSIAQLQARLLELSSQNTPEARAEIKKCKAQIGELLKGAGKVETAGGELSISEEMGFRQNNKVANDEIQEQMGEFARDGAGSKDAAKEKIKDEFGADALDDAEYKAKKDELKAAEKELKELQKQEKKIKFDKNDPEAYNKAQAEIQPKLQAQRDKIAQLQNEMVDIKADRRGDSNKFAKRFEKAAHKNYEQYEETQEVQYAFLDKKEAEAFVEKNPDAKGKTAVVSNDDMEALNKLYNEGKARIAEAEETGDEAQIKAAQERYGEYVQIFGTKEDGSVDYTKINVEAVQNVLVDKSGGDQNFNLDEIEVTAKDLNMSKGEIKHLAKTFGFGRESQLPAKFAAAGIAAGSALVGNAINWALGNTHSHKGPVTDTKTATGETVSGDIHWIASNGEEFYHYYEAQGGTATATAVAEACAKIPAVGQLIGPALAGVTAFLLTKGKTEDAFKGANVEEVLENIQTASKDAQPVLKQIRDMEITGDKKVDDAIKVAVIKASIGEDTKTANLRELSKAYIDLKNTKEKIKTIEGVLEEETEPTTETGPTGPTGPTGSTGPTGPTEPTGPALDLDVVKDPDVEVRTELPRLKYREGTWYTSHAYVDADGKELTPAERKQVKRLLEQEANRIAFVDTNNDGKANYHDKKVSLPTELELPNGKKVKVADDAYDRIMKLPAHQGDTVVNPKYGVHVAKINGKWHVIDPAKDNKRVAGPFDTEAQARAEEARLEAEANKPKETE